MFNLDSYGDYGSSPLFSQPSNLKSSRDLYATRSEAGRLTSVEDILPTLHIKPGSFTFKADTAGSFFNTRSGDLRSSLTLRSEDVRYLTSRTEDGRFGGRKHIYSNRSYFPAVEHAQTAVELVPTSNNQHYL